MIHHFPNAAATGLVFKKSKHSGASSNCVECASLPGEVVVRDSKDPQGPAHRYKDDVFARFALAVATDTLTPVS